MSEQEVKTLIYSALEKGLKPDEIISKHNLSNYKRNVQGCYTWFIKNGSKMKKQEQTQTEIYIQKCNDELLELSKAFDVIVNFANSIPKLNQEQGAFDKILEIVEHKFEKENLSDSKVITCYELKKDIRKQRRALKTKIRVAQVLSPSGNLADFTLRATKAKTKIQSIINSTGNEISDHYEEKVSNELNNYQHRLVKHHLEALQKI